MKNVMTFHEHKNWAMKFSRCKEREHFHGNHLKCSPATPSEILWSVVDVRVDAWLVQHGGNSQLYVLRAVTVFCKSLRVFSRSV